MKHLTRRNMLKGLLVIGTGAMSASVLASCGATATPAPAATAAPAGETPTAAPAEATAPAAASGEKINLVHSTWADRESPWGKYCAFLHAASSRKRNPNVTIEYQSTPWADYHTKLLTQIAAGSAPDTLSLRATCTTRSSWPRAALSSCSPSSMPRLTSTCDDFLPTSLRLSTMKGKLYGLPHISSAWVRIWNKKIFGDLGLPSPNEQDAAGEWTWETFLDAATKATKRGADGKAEIARLRRPRARLPHLPPVDVAERRQHAEASPT